MINKILETRNKFSKTLTCYRPGVLNPCQTKVLIEKGYITSPNPPKIDFSALDLHISNIGWEMERCIKGKENQAYTEVLANYGKRFDLEEGENNTKLLEKKKTYVFKLVETISFPKDSEFYGRGTGTSSMGRLDIFNRLIIDRQSSYDKIPSEYDGSLYLEITPITFSIKVRKGMAFNQLRIFRGNPELSKLNAEILKLYGPILFEKNQETISLRENCLLHLDLTPVESYGHEISALRAKENVKNEIDLTKGANSHEPWEFWDRLKCDRGEVELEPEMFYLFKSRERFKLPPDVAVYIRALTETLGEMRIHQAGFIHPNFGYYREKGTPVIFELRSHDIRNILRDGESIAEISFYRMSEPSELSEQRIKELRQDRYTCQEIELSKYFRKDDTVNS